MMVLRTIALSFLFLLIAIPSASAQESSSDLFSLDPEGGVLTESTFVMLDNPMSYDVRYQSGVNPRNPDCILSPRFTRALYIKDSTTVKLVACDSFRKVGSIVTHEYKMERPDLERRAISSFKRGTLYTVRPIRTRFFGENYRASVRQNEPLRNDPLNNAPRKVHTEQSLLASMYFTIPQGTYHSSFITYLVAPKLIDVRYEVGSSEDETMDPECGISTKLVNNAFKVDASTTFKFLACKGSEPLSKVRTVSYVMEEQDIMQSRHRQPNYSTYSRPKRPRVKFRAQTMKGEPVIKTFQ